MTKNDLSSSYADTPQSLEDLCAKTDYHFRDLRLLRRAVTHRSFRASDSYEQLEFLGDRVLALVIAQWLLESYPDAAEGELAKRHVALVNSDALRDVGQGIDLQPHLLFSRADKVASSNKNLAALPDAMEALLGALYLDGGLPVAEAFIKKHWADLLHVETAPSESKTRLQEFAQKRGLPLPVYEVISQDGPSHAPAFTVRVSLQGFESCEGSAKSKREAEKKAAACLLEILDRL
ncbi:MAG: ribonuclease III [Alphaproteobacteria bacterium]|nr:ribonuclease III [Alphaproteobacteria bacterium]